MRSRDFTTGKSPARSASFPARAFIAVVVASAGMIGFGKAPVELTVALDQQKQGTLGLPAVSASHQMLYDSGQETFRFCHHPNIVVYNDRLYAMWSNGIASEDFNGQRVLWTHSSDGEVWSKPDVLVPDPDGETGELCAVPAGIHVNGRTLVAYYSAMKRSSTGHISTVYAVTSEDTRSWSKPHRIIDGFFIENPRVLPSGRILLNGQFPDAAACLLYTDSSDGLTGWKAAKVPPFPDVKPGFPEPNWFRRKDGTIVMLFRTAGSTPWLYASESTDNGASYTAPERTDLPSCTSRMAVGNLPDGRAFCIWNPSQKFGRNPLVIALSDDGKAFGKAFIMRGEPTGQRHVGTHKANGWQYPAAVVWRNALWVVYSVNKEDIVVSRIVLEDLR